MAIAIPECVVDASAVAAVAFGEPEAADVAHALDGRRLLACSMIGWEMANILLVKSRRHPQHAAALERGFDWYLDLHLAVVPVAERDVVACALRFGLTAYDAGYLALALQRQVPLVTLDKRLARAWAEATAH